jgi:hypothetical protein
MWLIGAVDDQVGGVASLQGQGLSEANATTDECWRRANVPANIGAHTTADGLDLRPAADPTRSAGVGEADNDRNISRSRATAGYR